ncbi:MAG: saccharopine dehydrogenase NADP-binding domain-containing protein [Clostridiales bacterium]|nr:saccharopine dehydrogenase NADP-binding domain-containing protein [Clostridiales bacterium]
MKRILILGCNEITKRLVLALCADRSLASGIAIASENREDSDDIKNLAARRGFRVTTSAINLNNLEAAMMMVKITAPELIVNLMPAEFTQAAMDMASQIGADYIDGRLCGVPLMPLPTSLLSEQFKKFGAFQHAKKTAVCGAGFNPGVLTTIVRSAVKNDFFEVSSAKFCVIPGDSADKSEKKDASGESEHVDVLYSEDIKNPNAGKGVNAAQPVIYVSEGKATQTEEFSKEAKSSGGRQVFMTSNPVITDFLKEIPDIQEASYYEPVVRREGRKVPTEKIEMLRGLGLLSDKPVRVGNAIVRPIDLVAEILPKRMAETVTPEESKDVVYKGEASYEIYVTGQKNGKVLTRLYKITANNDEIRDKYGVSALEYLDGSAIIAGVKLMCLDKWSKPGVFTPAAFPADLYYEALKKEGITVEEGESQPL